MRVCRMANGGAARLTEARVSIMQRKANCRADAFAAERRRAAPHTRPDKISASMFPLVRAMHSNPLRSRARRFESCRGHRSRHKFEHLNDLDAPQPWVCDLRLRNGAIMFAPVRSPNGRPFCPDQRLRVGHSRMSTTLCHQHQGVDVQAHQQPDVRDAVLGRSRLGPVLVVARTPAIKPSVVTTYLIAAR